MTNNTNNTNNPNIYRGESVDMLVPISSTDKHSIELKPGVWNSNEIGGTEYIPNDAPVSYKIYRRLNLSYINKRTAYENLYWSGGIPYTQYISAMQDMENNIEKLRTMYQYPSVSLLIVNGQDNPPVQVKLFDDEYLCDFFTRGILGVSVQDIRLGQVPNHLKGTQVFEQEWHTSRENLIHKYPKLDNMPTNPSPLAGHSLDQSRL